MKMNEPTFLIPLLAWNRSPGLAEFEVVLELLPLPSLLVDTQTFRIRLANSKALDLLLRKKAEINNLDFFTIFKDLDGSNLDKEAVLEERIIYLTRQTLPSLQVQISPTRLSPKGNWVLISLVEPALRQQKLLDNNRFQLMWEYIRSLVNAYHQPECEMALIQALQAGQNLTGADFLVIYKAAEKSPGLLRWVSTSAVDFLPNQLPTQDLVNLQTPALWTHGKRLTSNLHRIAHANRLSSLATVPLGQTNAVIGLIVIGNYSKPPPDQLIQISLVLAENCSAIIQQFLVNSQFEKGLLEYKQSHRMTQVIEESVQEGILVLNRELQITRLNPAAEMILGYAGVEVEGRPVHDILIGPEMLLPALSTVLENHRTFHLKNIRLYNRIGEGFLAHLNIYPVLAIEDLEGLVITIQDLSEQEQIQARTLQLEHQAHIGQITQVFAHEVRNPISNISMGLQLMATNFPEKDPNQELIYRLQQDCDRLAELMKSVLSYSKSANYQIERFDVRQLLQRILERQHPRFERAKVKHRFRADRDVPLIDGDPRSLEQVFNNIINNALQAMGENGGHLVVKVFKEIARDGHPCVEVSIADSGPGIPKEIQGKIFQPFFTSNRTGTGLGLAIAKQIITDHKGIIDVTSVPGGTVFQIQIPVPEKDYS